MADSESTALVERLLGGYRDTQMLYVVAALGIADHLALAPMHAQDLAVTVNANPGALYRLLRTVSGLGVFRERPDGRFEMTAAAQLLRSDVPGSVVGKALSYGESWWWGAWKHMLDCVRSGRSAFDQQHGQTLFQFLADRPGAAAAFNANMASMTATMAPLIASAMVLKKGQCVADIGGGRGVLMAAMLNTFPGARGVLLEQGPVLAEARQYMDMAGLAGRCEFREGDIFGSMVCEADVYVLKEVIHDWNDEQATEVLRNCRKAMRKGARLVLVERLVGPANQPSEASLIDMVMLVMTGGMERTEQQYRMLLHATQFDAAGTVHTPCGLSLLSAVAC